MKKILLLLPFLSLSVCLQAQINIGVGLGYQFPASRQVMGSNYTNNQQTAVAGSYSRGFLPVIQVGVPIDKSFSFWVELGNQVAPKYEFDAVDSMWKRKEVESVKQFSISPFLVLNPCDQYIIHPYFKAGFVFVPAARLTNEYTISSVNGNSVTQENSLIKMHPALGLSGGIGGEYPLNKMISIFGEFSGQALSLNAKSGEFTKYTVNGTNYLDNLPDDVKSWEYDHTIKTNVQTGPRIESRFGASCFAIRLGARFIF